MALDALTAGETMDCHVDSYKEARPTGEKPFRGQVVHTATGAVLFTTWPYASERSAVDRARRWLREEYKRNETPDELPLLRENP